MKNLKNNIRGSFLLEAILYVFIGFIVIIPLLNLLQQSLRTLNFLNKDQNIVFDREYSLSYIEAEFNQADKIFLLSDKDRYKFILYKHNLGSLEEHNFTSYIVRDNTLYRVAKSYEGPYLPGNVRNIRLRGNNVLAYDVSDFNIEISDKKVSFKIKLKDGSLERKAGRDMALKMKIIDLR